MNITATSTSIGTNDETIKDVADSSRSILDSIYHGDYIVFEFDEP